ncbi:MAG TPA: porin [Usitatibacter sp.]|nr:porin [Usitatibacter sp.]
MHVLRRYSPLLLAVTTMSGAVHAQSDPEALKRQIDQLQRQIDELKATVERMQAKPPAPPPSPPPASLAAQAPQDSTSASFVRLKPNSGATFLVPGGGEVQLYGNFDVSVDSTTKGLKSDYGDNGGQPVGKMGWQPAVSTNLSYFGMRGTHPLREVNFIWQLEAGIDISATPGTKQTTSNISDSVNGALFSRNSFIGFADQKLWGAVMVGKSETPYKTSTDRLNPFSGMLGDYRVIMGNTGGDNRVEFGLRAAHAIWYESPGWSGVSFKAMYSPGQNRDGTSSIVASAEPDCAGGNIPGSGALPPTCNDGSFGDLSSVSLSYLAGSLYLTTAYELHKHVNRTSDLPNLDPRDTADESAYKVGGQYSFPTHTTISLLWERTKRKLPAELDFQNERTRPNATWVALTQVLTHADSVSFGWAHAGSTPGDPGQHNTPGGANPDNEANMYTVAWRHALDRSLTFYVDYAMTNNHADAHYDLGAGGHGVTTDCHDSTPMAAFDPTTGAVSNEGPHCFAGGKLQGISVGAAYRF